MFKLLVLLNFSIFLATKCLTLNDEPCLFGPTLIAMNPNVLKYYPLMISLNKYTGSCNVLPPNMCVPKEPKHIHVKAFNMTTNKDKAKAVIEHISGDCKCKFNSATCNSEQKCNNKTCQHECKNYRKCKENYHWNRSRCTFENAKYLKSVADTSVTKCHEIVIVMDNLSPRKTNTIARYVTNTVSINFHSKIVIFYVYFY